MRVLRHLAWACAEIKILKFLEEKSLGFSIFEIFSRLQSFFSFSFLFAAMIDLLLGLLVKESVIETGKFLPYVVAGNYPLSFSLNFFSIFVHISGSIIGQSL